MKITLLLTLLFVQCFILKAQYTLTTNDVTVTNGYITSCSYDFSETNIIIPDSLDNQRIIGISSATQASRGVFYDKSTTEISLPTTIIEIGDYVF